MRYNKGRIKVFNLPSKEEYNNNLFYTTFQLGTSALDRLEINEPIQVLIGELDNNPKHAGLAEIISIKLCSIKDIDSLDFSRQKEGFKDKKSLINFFKGLFPKKKDINLSSLVTVITLKKLDYNLRSLNKIFNDKDKKVG